MANLHDPHYDQIRDRDGFRARRARLGRQAGASRLGVSLWELPPGQAAYPYHFHYVEEELLIVLEGAPSLRTPDGWRALAPGEVVSLPRGATGAHQLLNETAETVRFLSCSTSGEPDIVSYPDSGKLGAVEREPGEGRLNAMFRVSETVDYYDGETPPRR